MSRSHLCLHRVRFNEEVQQAFCSPDTIDIYPFFISPFEKQDSVMSGEEAHYVQLLFAARAWERTVLPLPPTRLNPIEDPSLPPSSPESVSSLDESE